MKKPITITKEQFVAFKAIRDMGIIKTENFNNMSIVIRKNFNISLSKDECLDIYRNYSSYLTKFK